MSILILGAGKSGTTGLYNSIKAAVADTGDWYFLFEPTKPEPFRALQRFAPERPILTKVMIHRAAACELDKVDFAHRILVIRDPRDIVVSRLLFRPLIRSAVRKSSPQNLEKFLDALREKEADPSSWSLHGLHELADELNLGSSGFRSLVRTLDDLTETDRNRSYFTSRYEAFVDGDLDELSDYVGVRVVNRAAAEDSWLAHITRSKGYGDWRHWFREDDIDYFRPLFGAYMDHFAYTDWELAPEPAVDPDSSSDYIKRKLAERAPQVQARYGAKWSVESVKDDREVRSMLEMAEDGDPVSAQRLALLLRAGHRVELDPVAAQRWARHGAIQGHAPSMLLLADLLEDGPSPDAEAAVRWRSDAAVFAEAASPKKGAAKPGKSPADAQLRKARRRIRQLEREMADLRDSARYQVGDVIVDSFTGPRRDLLRLPSRLRAIYRSRRPR